MKKLKLGKMKKLIVFDVDGVILDNKIGAFKEILVFLGKEKQARRIDEEYQKRKLVAPWGLEQLAQLYKDVPQEKLKRLTLNYCQDNLMKGAERCFIKLKKRRYMAGALSSNPQFVMNVLSEMFSLSFAEGTKLEFKEGVATGKIVRPVDRHVKAQLLKEKMDKLYFEKQKTIVVGDSITDIPMAEKAGLFIAFNPKEEIKEKANIVVKEKDLSQILNYI